VSGGQKQLKRGHQSQVYLDQMVLMMASLALLEQWPKTQTLNTKLSSRGTTRLESTQIRWFSW
jgi:hypothetical protein